MTRTAIPELAPGLPIDAPLRLFRKRFATLPDVPPGWLVGRFDGLLVGPRAFQRFFLAALTVGGLAGWRGKEFAADGQGANLCERHGALRRVAPMYVKGQVASVTDGKPTLALGYRGTTPLRLITDELRLVDEHTALGLTYVDVPLLPRVPLPFVLRKAAGV
jgi:hypothetical protein